MDSQEARIYTAVIISLIVIGIIILYFFVSIIRQQRRNLELHRQNILAQITVLEKERARVAADLHDDISPMLSVVKFQVDTIESANDNDLEQLKEASRFLDEMSHKIREISNDLMPSSLLRKGFIAAVSEYIEKVKEAANLALKFSYPPDMNIPEEMNANVYRIIQEIIHNCRKHAGATKMEIILEEKNNTLIIVTRDNGKGFNYKKTLAEGRGIGLSSIKNRAEIMGGTVAIESSPGKGTAYQFKIPLTKRTLK